MWKVKKNMSIYLALNPYDGGRYHLETSPLSKSMDWFLYDIGLRHERVKEMADYLIYEKRREKKTTVQEES